MARTRRKNSSNSKIREDRKDTKSGSLNKTNTKESNSDELATKEVSAAKDSPNPANDPAWYSRDEGLLRDAANLPFSLPFGAEVPTFPTDAAIPGLTSTPLNADNTPIPGVCSLVIKPSMGLNLSKSSPANVCANALYTHVRYINSGRKNYDPADLFMYVTTFGEIYSFLIWNIRIYNYAYMYSQRNWYFGRDLILANGIDPDDIVANLANYRYWINSMINKISSFCLPADIDYFKRRVWVFSNCYIENPYSNLKDQLYQLVPEGFYKFELDTNYQAGKLAYHKLPNIAADGSISVYMKMPKLVEIFEDLMENITGDEDFGLMSGDILKAYQGNIITLSQIGPEGGILPVYDPYVLSQFKNAVTVSYATRDDSTATWTDDLGHTHVIGDVEQTTNGLVVSVETYDTTGLGRKILAARGINLAMNHPISVENPVPGPGDVIEATRFVAALGDFIDGGTHNHCIICGSDLVVNLRVATKPYNKALGIFPVQYGNLNAYNSSDGLYLTPINEWAYIASHFKYIPLCWMIESHTSGSDLVVDAIKLYSNVENVAMCDSEITRRLHEVALLSLFYVPGVAKIL